MPVAVKPIIDRNLPPIYISYDILEEIPVTTYIFCIPFQNAAAIGANGYNTIYARISGISGYSYAIRPPYALTSMSDIKEEYLQKVQDEYDLDREFAETYFHNSLELLERLGRVAEDQEYVICVDIQNSSADPIGLVPRQFYKVQLAYGYKNESGINQISAYSDYGIAKCVCQQRYPIILDMQGFTTEAINLQTTQDLVGRFYSQDLGERVTEFRFTITNLHDDNDIIYTTGWLPHNSASDTITSATTDENGGNTLIITSTDTAPMRKNLKLDQICQIRYEVYTTNKIYKSQDYAIVNQAWGANDFPGRLVAKPKVETGEIILTMAANSDLNNVSGMYRIEKATEDQSYSNWEAICELRLYHSRIEDGKPIYKDKCVEQGRKYKYSIYKYALTSDGREIRTQRFYTRPVTAQFEDMFLYDGVRQLNIRFNPKVSTFKTVKLENKTETIGGKYPFLSRNGHTNYKQFAISGLISVLMDDQMTFWADPQYDGDSAARASTPSTEDAAFRHFHSTNLENWNITRERDFKLDVLDWLNDGKPKLLRTATEGNYIVALQGVSLSPMDQLGRMLHSFSATAYEIDDLNIETLKKYNMSGVQLNYYNTSIYNEDNLNEIKLYKYQYIWTPSSEEEIDYISISNDDPYKKIKLINTDLENNETLFDFGEFINCQIYLNLLVNDKKFEQIDITCQEKSIEEEMLHMNTTQKRTLSETSEGEGHFQLSISSLLSNDSNLISIEFLDNYQTIELYDSLGNSLDIFTNEDDSESSAHLILGLDNYSDLNNIKITSNESVTEYNINLKRSYSILYQNSVSADEIYYNLFNIDEGQDKNTAKSLRMSSINFQGGGPDTEILIYTDFPNDDIKPNTFYSLGADKELSIILDSDNNNIYQILMKGIKDTNNNYYSFELTTENYLGGFNPVTGSFSFSYIQVLLDQNTNDGIKGPNNTNVNSNLPLCVCGYQHLSDAAQSECNHWLDTNNTFLLNSIYQLRISRENDNNKSNNQENWLWDASALNDSQIVNLTRLTPDEKNDIILGNLGDGKHDEIILTQEDLDDVSILMAGSNLRIEVAYLYANDVSIEEQNQTQDSNSNG